MRLQSKITLFAPLVILVLVLLWQFFRPHPEEQLPYQALLQELKTKPENIKKIQIDTNSDEITVSYNEPKDKIILLQGPSHVERVTTIQPLLDKLDPKKVSYKKEEKGFWLNVLSSSLPFVLLLFAGFFLLRFLQNSSNRGLGFTKARIQTMDPESKTKVTFADVAGIEEAKQEVQELVDFLKDPKKFTKLGGRIPKGVLLTGSPGTGKTLLARAIAGEADVPFFSMPGSAFEEMLVGLGASRVRELFDQAKKNAPCIVFIDEIDAVGRQRNNRMRGHPSEDQTLNQLLVEMDGFDTNQGVILIAATNRPDVLDPALLRPGRFDRHVIVPLPDIRGREEILKVHSRKVPLSTDVNLSILARGTPGFSGAELEAIINEAALLAARKDKESVSMHDLEEAKAKVLMGPERKSMVISEHEKRLTAYHEAGHALVATLVPGTDPVHLVTIIPRGPALGITQQLPNEDRLSAPRAWIEGRIAVCMGGRVAEELIFGDITTGASNDIEQATDLARKMVCEWGMSEKVGPLALGKSDSSDYSLTSPFSEETSRLVDAEIRRIVTSQHERAKHLLTSHLEQLKLLAETLLEKETIHADELQRMLTKNTTEVSLQPDSTFSV